MHHNDPAVIRTRCTPRRPGPSSAWATTRTARPTRSRSGWPESSAANLIPVHPSAATVHGFPPCPIRRHPDGTTVNVVNFYVNSSSSRTASTRRCREKERLGIGALWLQLGVIDEDVRGAGHPGRVRRRHGHVSQDRVAPHRAGRRRWGDLGLTQMPLATSSRSDAPLA